MKCAFNRIHRLSARGLALTVLTACSAAANDPGTPPPGEPTISIAPRQGAPGEEVRITASGFPATSSVVIGFGPPQSEYSELSRVQTDAQGSVSTSVAVPSWAESGRDYVWVVADPSTRPRAISDPFQVTGDPRAGVAVEGRITAEGVECPAMRDDADRLYTLAGAPDWVQTGQRVRVEGTIAEISICQQGTTITVEQIRRVS